MCLATLNSSDTTKLSVDDNMLYCLNEGTKYLFIKIYEIIFIATKRSKWWDACVCVCVKERVRDMGRPRERRWIAIIDTALGTDIQSFASLKRV